tara:strand:+ start:11530 stop:12267 length:738 start_codon:yes stop_codon:yes gene_type:complete
MELIYDKIFFNQGKNILFQLSDFKPFFYADKKEEELEIKQEKKLKKTYYQPKQRDSLFWCFYICAYGFDEYNCIQRNYGVREIEIKQQGEQYVKNNYKELKESNIKMTKSLMQDIMSDFNTNIDNTNFYNFFALCFMKKINIYILHEEKSCYLSFFYHKDSPYFLVKQEKFNKYSLQLEPMLLSEVIEIESKYYCLESWLKPIKAISNYKVTDLQEIAYRMELEDIPNMKKQELYDYIYDSLSWY